jgi:hypothetical protein
LVFGVAVDTFEVGFELVPPGRVFVLLPVVVEVFGGYAGGEAAQARGEVDQAGEVGDAVELRGIDVAVVAFAKDLLDAPCARLMLVVPFGKTF